MTFIFKQLIDQISLKKVVILVCSLFFTKFNYGLIAGIVVPVFPDLVKAMSNSGNSSYSGQYKYDYLSLLFCISSVTKIVMSPLLGCVLESVGCDVIIAIGIICQSTTLLFYGFSGSYLSLLVLGRLFDAFSYMMMTSGFSSLIAEEIQDLKYRGLLAGFGLVAILFGQSLGSVYSGYMYQNYGFKLTSLFILPFITLSFVLSLVYIALYHGILKSRRNAVVEKFGRHLIKDFGHFLIDPYFLLCLGIYFPMFLSFGQLTSTLPKYMSDRFDATNSQQGLVWLPMSIVCLVGLLIGNWLNSRFTKKKFLIIFCVLLVHGFGVLLICFMPTWWLISVPLSIVLIQYTISEPIIYSLLTLITEKYHKSCFGIMSGFISFMNGVVMIVATFCSPLLLREIGYLKLSVIITVINVAYSFMSIFLKRVE